MSLNLNVLVVLYQRIRTVLYERMGELSLNKAEIEAVVAECRATVPETITLANDELVHKQLERIARKLGVDPIRLAFWVEETDCEDDEVMDRVGERLQEREQQLRKFREERPNDTTES